MLTSELELATVVTMLNSFFPFLTKTNLHFLNIQKLFPFCIICGQMQDVYINYFSYDKILSNHKTLHSFIVERVRSVINIDL